jgi:hypothetical protein
METAAGVCTGSWAAPGALDLSSGATGAAPQVMEAVCRQVAAEVRLYQESIRSQEELMDTTGVELVQGRTSGKARPMLVIKQEKLDRAANYARVSCTGQG